MRLPLLGAVFLLSTSAARAEVPADCRSTDAIKVISACTTFLQGSGVNRSDQAFAYALRAEAFLSQNQIDAAAKDVDKAIDLNPSSPSALTARARLAFRKNDNKRALSDLDAVIKQVPNAANARRLRGLVHMELTQYKEAKADLDWVISNNPSDGTAYGNRGRLLRLMGDMDGSLRDLDTAVALAPKWVYALVQRSDSHQLKRDYQKSLADLDTALLIAPNDPGAQQRRNAVLALMKSSGAATTAPAKQLPAPQTTPPPQSTTQAASSQQAPPPTTPALTPEQALQQGRTLLARGDTANAFKVATNLVKTYPNMADAYDLRARVYYQERLYQQAIDDLTKVISLKPSDVPSYYIRGLARAESGRFDDAHADANDIQKLVPSGDPRGHQLRGWIHYVAGGNAKAEEEYSAAINIKASDFLYTNRALARMEMGRFDDADADLKAAYALNARSARVLSTRGQLQVRKGQVVLGEASFKEALAIEPNLDTARIGQQAIYAVRAIKQVPAPQSAK